ncbi:translation initiation factor IF-2-like [Gallus gallus]|uniref:translation initiation factor IF-2-like n=1 Tax=Gallus gallus TaxID=9031 RepID=UPI001F019361|nr:translation initiation factor IF-2-like [Gallus gallus]
MRALAAAMVMKSVSQEELEELQLLTRGTTGEPAGLQCVPGASGPAAGAPAGSPPRGRHDAAPCRLHAAPGAPHGDGPRDGKRASGTPRAGQELSTRRCRSEPGEKPKAPARLSAGPERVSTRGIGCLSFGAARLSQEPLPEAGRVPPLALALALALGRRFSQPGSAPAATTEDGSVPPPDSPRGIPRPGGPSRAALPLVGPPRGAGSRRGGVSGRRRAVFASSPRAPRMAPARLAAALPRAMRLLRFHGPGTAAPRLGLEVEEGGDVVDLSGAALPRSVRAFVESGERGLAAARRY